MNVLESLRTFFRARGTSAYFVGGTVRDVLLRRELHDIDVSVVGEATPLARAFADEIGAAFYVMDADFDVARVIMTENGSRTVVDLARVRGGTIEHDLATRDFTINAMAAEAGTWSGDSSEVIDPFDGQSDLKARRLRVVAATVFDLDPVRLLRATRMEAELGFALDTPSESLVRRGASKLRDAPQERVRDEFVRLLAAKNVQRNLYQLDELGLLNQVLPELEPLRGVEQSPPHTFDVFNHSIHAVAAWEETERARFQNIVEGAFSTQLGARFDATLSAERTRAVLMRLTLLLHDIGKPGTRTQDATGRNHFYRHEESGAELAQAALRRLRFSNDEIESATTIIRHHLRPILLAQTGASDRAVHRFFRDAGDVGIDVAVHAWCDQRATYGDPMPPEANSALQAVISRMLDRYYHAHAQVIAPPAMVDGNDLLRELNLSPGPQIGKLLQAIREAQAVGEVTSRDQALEFAGRFLEQNPVGSSR